MQFTREKIQGQTKDNLEMRGEIIESGEGLGLITLTKQKELALVLILCSICTTGVDKGVSE